MGSRSAGSRDASSRNASSRSSTASAAAFTNRATLAYPTGDPKTSALLVEKSSPSEIIAGQPFDYNIVVSNLTSNTLENVTVTEKLPSNFKLMSSDPQIAMEGAGSGSFNVGNLGPKAKKTIRVRGEAASAGNITTCSSVSYNTGVCISVPVVSPSLALTCQGPTEALLCDKIEYRYRVANSGSGTARNVKVNVALPDGMTTADGRKNFTATVASLRGGESKEMTMPVKVSKVGKYAPNATANADGGLSAKSSSCSTNVSQPKLEVAIKGREKEFAGKQLCYDVTVKNTGNGVSRNTVLETAVPSGATVESASNNGKVSGGKIVWNIGDLRPNDAKAVKVCLRTKSLGKFTTSVKGNADCADPVTASASTEVTGIPAVLLEVVDLEDPIRVGETQTYEITVTNQGSAEDTDISIVCTLPSNVELVSATGATNAAAGAGASGKVTLTPLPTLKPGTKATWRVVVRAKGPADARFGVVMNTAELTRPVEETEATNYYE